MQKTRRVYILRMVKWITKNVSNPYQLSMFMKKISKELKVYRLETSSWSLVLTARSVS
ncbi:hypothetical protein YC2023_044947 [Brassica napus]